MLFANVKTRASGYAFCPPRSGLRELRLKTRASVEALRLKTRAQRMADEPWPQRLADESWRYK